MSCFSRRHGKSLKVIHSVVSPWSVPNRCLAVFLFILCSTIARPLNAETYPPDFAAINLGESGDTIQIAYRPQLKETIYTLKGECEINWIVYDSEINSGVVKHDSECDQALQFQIPTLALLLEEIIKTDEKTQPLHTLFWGRLLATPMQKACEMSFRLALAAHKSRAWDKRRGRPRQGAETDFVKEAANNMMIYPELDALFRAHGLHLSLASAEKVLVTEARELPFYDHLKKHGVLPGDRLPYDAMVWFSISRWERSDLEKLPSIKAKINHGS